ncbi:hypothetical protein [Rhizohabitans arisaemae]|uniref:hypothetical protein n=1 Tax=Rhizohabitans arisaemae TaxID=2720610 RepID=UPI0024B17F69|nr:hypothetical protein [Rhizohabitans arisaemae]
MLTLGLIRRRGEVFPRRIPGLRGRRVPPLPAVVPAGSVSIIGTVAEFTYVRLGFTEGFEPDDWGAWLPSCLWPIWGAALAVAAASYHRRRSHDARQALEH